MHVDGRSLMTGSKNEITFWDAISMKYEKIIRERQASGQCCPEPMGAGCSLVATAGSFSGGMRHVTNEPDAGAQ